LFVLKNFEGAQLAWEAAKHRLGEGMDRAQACRLLEDVIGAFDEWGGLAREAGQMASGFPLSGVVLDTDVLDTLTWAQGEVGHYRDAAREILDLMRRPEPPAPPEAFAEPVAGPIPFLDPARAQEALEQLERGEGRSHAEVFSGLRQRDGP
jgi:hypothetical protein